ncbi:hypothetical protein Ct9H90mP12_0680 [bacterium]|nr:MAG: hypothetical protein Ct9H90mP12_0680 [bacterium]
MKRIPKKASNKYAGYFELTKPSIKIYDLNINRTWLLFGQ